MNQINENYLDSSVDCQEYVAKLNKALIAQLDQLRQQFDALSCQSENFTKEGIEVKNLSVINSNLTMHNLIYKMTNTVNGHFYIGKHSTKYPLDSYYGSGIILKEAYLKYGLSSFQKTILYDFKTSDEALAKEEELVPILSCHDNTPCCYNMKPGGVGHLLSSSAKKSVRIRKNMDILFLKKHVKKLAKAIKEKRKAIYISSIYQIITSTIECLHI